MPHQSFRKNYAENFQYLKNFPLRSKCVNIPYLNLFLRRMWSELQILNKNKDNAYI